MPTAIDRQVEAFGRSVQEDQPDMGGDLQDLVHAGIMVARLIVQRSAEYRAVERPDPAKAAIAAERCRRLLGMMVQVQDQSLRLKEAGLELRHEDEFQDAGGNRLSDGRRRRRAAPARHPRGGARSVCR
jgi:hypothetical protein